VFYPTTNVPSQPLAEHWDGSNWSIIPSPNPGGSNFYNVLSEVATISSNDVWAVGYYTDNKSTYQAITEHWNGLTWSIVPNASISYAELLGVKAASSNNVVAVGTFWNGTNWQALTEDWNGTSWNFVGSPTVGASRNNLFEEITGLSTNNIWAVGLSWDNNKGPDQTLTERWNGQSWNVVPSPNFGTNVTNDLFGVAEISANDIWAIGAWDAGNNNFQVLAEHWNGSQWIIIPPASMKHSLHSQRK
jgi:hypothetical protein